ncbi:MAG TPA: FKBP-type peptidyl-prolyl cis-trans isomerase [Flavisolibacter sp.]|nr:FKBP-type peptidyl-prolyl cis-trans isomerase [Flavisolibacter sp.]
MKKLWIAGLVLFSVSASAQKTTPKKKTGTAVAAKPFKNGTDSLSYALGVSVASFYKQQGVNNLNTTVLSKAIGDVLGGKKPILNENQCNSIIMTYMQKAEAEKSKPNIDEGQKFLAQNRAKPNVKSTATGLQYEVISQGNGPRPLATDTVVVNYRGTLINGTEFDNSYQRGEPISFPLNRVIPGWTEGLQLMPVGSKYKFYIPHQLGYGLNGAGSIPGGSTLIFEVELLSIKK